MDKILIIAGNYHQYLDYIKENKLDPNIYIFVNREENLCGWKDNTKILKIGTWRYSLIAYSDMLCRYNVEIK